MAKSRICICVWIW